MNRKFSKIYKHANHNLTINSVRDNFQQQNLKQCNMIHGKRYMKNDNRRKRGNKDLSTFNFNKETF